MASSPRMVVMNHPLRERLQKALQDRNMQQKHFAAAAGVSESTISYIMQGRNPRYDTFIKVEAALTQIERRGKRRRAATA